MARCLLAGTMFVLLRLVPLPFISFSEVLKELHVLLYG